MIDTFLATHNIQPRSQRSRRSQPTRRRQHSPRTITQSRPMRTPPFELAPHDATPVDFASLKLDPRVNRALGDLGFVRTTPIQSAVFQAVSEGRDLVGCAQTGTGKTAAFLLPIIERLLAGGEGRRGSTRVLILAPTRELAVQIEEDFQGLAYQYRPVGGRRLWRCRRLGARAWPACPGRRGRGDTGSPARSHEQPGAPLCGSRGARAR